MNASHDDPVYRRETKAQFRTRLEEEGRWDKFVSDKQAMQARGVQAEVAYWQLRDGPEYQPLSLVQQAFANRPKAVEFVEGEKPYGVETQAQAWQKAARKKKEGRAVSMLEIARWVFENMDNPAVSLDMAPSMGAMSLLSWCNKDRANQTEFYRSWATRLLPSKAEVDNQLSFADDGRKIFGALSKFEAAAIEQGMYSLAGTDVDPTVDEH